MISKIDKKLIAKISKRYNAKRVIMFGSSIFPHKKSNDIDIGVEGIADNLFFRYYGDLLCSLSKPVDVIDLSTNSKFNTIIRREGQLLYGQL
jgi:predicted nucleotidyltransferase